MHLTKKSSTAKDSSSNTNAKHATILKQQRDDEALNFDINESIYNIGDRVKVRNDEIGKIRFIGPVEFASGVWAGIELEALTGKNDGSVNGQQYFTLKKRAKRNSDKNYGLFVRIENMLKIEKKIKNVRAQQDENTKKSKKAIKYELSGGSARNAIMSLRNTNTTHISEENNFRNINVAADSVGSGRNAVLGLRSVHT